MPTEAQKVTNSDVGQAPLNLVQMGWNMAVNTGSQQKVTINTTVINRNLPLP